MYFNFDDRQPDIERIEGAISWREGLLLSLAAHALGILAIVMLPGMLPGIFAALAPDASALEQRMAAMRGAGVERPAVRLRSAQGRIRGTAAAPEPGAVRSGPDHHDPVRADAGADQPAAVLEGQHDGARGPARHAGRAEARGQARGERQRREGSRLAGPGAPDHRDARDRRPRDSRAPRPEAAGAVREQRHGDGGRPRERPAGREPLRAEQMFDNPQGGGQFGIGHPVRHEGRRVRPVDAAVHRAGQAQLVHPVRGDVAARPRVGDVQRPQGRLDHRTSGRRARPASRRSTTRRSTPSRRRTRRSRCRPSTRRTGRSSPSRSTTTRRRPHADGASHPHAAARLARPARPRWRSGRSLRLGGVR